MKESAVDDKQLQTLVEDINEEFDSLKRHMDDIRQIKDTIKSGEFEKRTNSLKAEIAEVRVDHKALKSEFSKFSTQSQIESLVSDINKEFDSLKAETKELWSGLKGLAVKKDIYFPSHSMLVS